MDILATEFLDDHRALEPPDPIPNSVVKRCIADGSVGFPHVRVGHRQDSFRKTLSAHAGRVLSFWPECRQLSHPCAALCKPTTPSYHASLIPSRDWHAEVVESPQGWPVPFRRSLGAALGVSRSAVWKQLQHLESELNLTIHKVRGRGYQLVAPLSLLDAQAIAELSEGECWPVFIHETIDSTNAEGLRLASEGQSAPFLVLAERQSAGRGRRGRTWISPFAENLYYSLVLRVDGGMRQLEGSAWWSGWP